nr:polyadenylate-binding protein-interacting protein 9-like [Tanacetum cinerariifolium]
ERMRVDIFQLCVSCGATKDSAQAALNLSGVKLGISEIRVRRSKSAILPVNPSYVPQSEDEMEKCARTVFCTNIDNQVSRAELKRFFETTCGEVSVMRHLRDGNRTTSMAFIEFVTIRALMGTQDVWECVAVGYEEPSASEVSAMSVNQLKAWKEKRMKDKAALYLLFPSMNELRFEKIAEATTSKEALETLEKQVRLQTLRSELEAMKMKDQKVFLITSLVCKRWFPKIVEDGANDFYNCGKSGHYARDCRLPNRVEENTNLVIKKEKVDRIVMMVYEDVIDEEVKVDDIVMMTYEDDVFKETIWYLDTAARNHMCGDKHQFVKMKDLVDWCVSFSDELKVQVKGRGTVFLSHNDKEIRVEDMYYILSLKRSIDFINEN